MKSISKAHHGSLNELNITPLLDLVFVLLVIFIITTPQMINNLEMSLPSGKPPPPKSQQPKINRIFLNDAGQVFLNDEPLELAALKSRLTAIKTAERDPAVVVKADDNVNYQRMVTVLDMLQQLDITKVGLATTDKAR